MKARDKHKVETLRGLGSDLKYRRIELGDELSEEETRSVLQKAAKRRRESIEVFRQGGREDLRALEQAELDLILSYLPPELSDLELDSVILSVITESGASQPGDVGRIMKQVMPRVSGLASGERVRARALGLLGPGATPGR